MKKTLPIISEEVSASSRKNGRVLLLTPNLKGLSDPNSVHRIQPPLGLMIQANILRQQGHQVKIHDTALADFYHRPAIDEKTVIIGQKDEDIKKVIETYQPEVVGISALFSNLMDSAHNLARLAKEVRPRCKVIMGGNHITNAVHDYIYAQRMPNSGLPIQMVDYENTHIDYIMQGEVDKEFPELVNALLQGGDISKIAGLVQRTGTNKYIINPAPIPLAQLSSLPHPARDLVDMEGYFSIGAFHSPKSRSKRVVNVMASRGCPEKCTFCTTPETWGSKVRWREIDDVIAEIKEAKDNYKVGEIQFEDDTITARKSRLLDLCKELEKVGLPWCTPNGTKVNYHKDTQQDMYKAMFDSGCYQITLACESGVQRVLDPVVHKNLQLEDMVPAIENAKKAGMSVHTFWVIGYPEETYEEICKTIAFAEQCGADSYSVAILSPLPGTPIYRQVVKENLWWPGRKLDDLLYRNSLVKVDGFNGPEEFEAFATEANVKLNSLLRERDPEKFYEKYGPDASTRMLVRQT